MYLKSFQIQNIRSIEWVNWELDDIECAAGWHVIIGDNGSGKSSLLRAIALALVGPAEAMALREDWNTWIRRESRQQDITLWLDWDKTYDRFSKMGRTATKSPLEVGVIFEKRDGPGGRAEPKTRHRLSPDPERHAWGGGEGWFSASYGPFRRFLGGDKDYEKMFYANPKLARHLSVFGESVALTECLSWLQALHVKKLEGRPEGEFLDPLIAFINQKGFLPHHAQIEEISSEGVRFVDGNGSQVFVEQLSDGYRSILSMTFELIRQLVITYGPSRVFDPEDNTKVIAPGVVLIDEVDAHLHPTWQRRVGVWFREHFPRLQFIVTTHSPLVCQAADQGTVYRLPRPGSEESGGMVEGIELNRLLYGDVLDAYGTDLFGQDITRSEASKAKLHRLVELNRKELHGRLSAKEKKELVGLRATLPTAAHHMGSHDETDE